MHTRTRAHTHTHTHTHKYTPALADRVGHSHESVLAIWQRVWQPTIEGAGLGPAALLWQCDVCMHMALLLQRARNGVPGGAAGGSDWFYLVQKNFLLPLADQRLGTRFFQGAHS